MNELLEPYKSEDPEFIFWKHDERLKTFSNWPFVKDSSCTPEEMAASGFYFVGSKKEPDLVRCYYCLRELDGWESEDIPSAEHGRKKCPFMELNKFHKDLTLEDAIKLQTEREIALNQKNFFLKVDELRDRASEGRDDIMESIGRVTKKRNCRPRKRKP